MKRMSGRVKNLKYAANSDPERITGSKTTIETIKTIIILNTIMRDLNFKRNTPIITGNWNHKIIHSLRQRCFLIWGQ